MCVCACVSIYELAKKLIQVFCVKTQIKFLTNPICVCFQYIYWNLFLSLTHTHTHTQKNLSFIRSWNQVPWIWAGFESQLLGSSPKQGFGWVRVPAKVVLHLSTEWSRAKASRVLPREPTGHTKHPLPTTQEKTQHIHITRWSTPKSDWLYSLQPKMEQLYTVSKNKTRSWLWLRSWTPYCQIQT